MGYGRTLGGAARTGYHAIRPALEVGREGGGREVGADYQPTIIFTPDSDLKDELKNTAVQITCYDRNGEEVKRVTSTDDGEIEDPETTNSGEGENTNGTNNTNGGENTGGENTGGDNNGGGGSGGGSFDTGS